MNVTLVVLTGVLVAVGVFLVLQRELTRIVLGLGMLGHAGVLALLVADGSPGTPPFAPARDVADPLPQAFALTAIVITFAFALLLLALAARSFRIHGVDEVEDDPEDARTLAAARANTADEADTEAADLISELRER